MSIIKPKPTGIFVPPIFIKEELDRVHRQEWDDPDRYIKEKRKALQYIPERASTIKQFSWEQLVKEVARVFHDDLAVDPDVKEAAQRACWAAEGQHHRDQDMGTAEPEPAAAAAVVPKGTEPRGDVRGVDDQDETIASLEWQQKEEDLS